MAIKIVPTDLPDDGEIGIARVTIEYIQSDDTNHGGRDDTQTIEFSTEGAIVDRDVVEKNGGFYFTMKTDRWAFDNEEEVLELIKDFKGKVLNNIKQ